MGFARKMKRAKEKQQYGRFSDGWRMEKTFQNYIVESGQGTVSGSAIVFDPELPQYKEAEPMPILGKKPTFGMWKRAIENQKVAAAAAPVQAPDQVTVEDTEWKE